MAIAIPKGITYTLQLKCEQGGGKKKSLVDLVSGANDAHKGLRRKPIDVKLKLNATLELPPCCDTGLCWCAVVMVMWEEDVSLPHFVPFWCNVPPSNRNAAFGGLLSACFDIPWTSWLFRKSCYSCHQHQLLWDKFFLAVFDQGLPIYMQLICLTHISHTKQFLTWAKSHPNDSLNMQWASGQAVKYGQHTFFQNNFHPIIL